MRRVLVAVALVTMSPVTAAAQVQEGHIFRVSIYRAHTERAGDYSEVYRDEARPVYDEMVRSGAITSYRLLVKDAGSGESSHMIVIEFPDWASVGQFDQNIDAAARRALSRPWTAVQQSAVAMRELISSELYTAP